MNGRQLYSLLYFFLDNFSNLLIHLSRQRKANKFTQSITITPASSFFQKDYETRISNLSNFVNTVATLKTRFAKK